MSRKSLDGVYPDDVRGGCISSTRALGQAFYVPGERHENLPAGGFARYPGIRDMSSNVGPPGWMGRSLAGTPTQSMWFVKQPFEITNAGDGQFGRAQMARRFGHADFGHADFGHGPHATRVGMGQAAAAACCTAAAVAACPSALTQLLTTAQQAACVVATLTPCQKAAAAVIAAKPVVASASSLSFLTTSYYGLPLIVWAALPVAGYFVGKKAKWF